MASGTHLIAVEPATVYRAGGRRWLTLKAACRAAARAKVKAKYPDEWRDKDFDIAPLMNTVARLARVYHRHQVACRTPPPRPEAAATAMPEEG